MRYEEAICPVCRGHLKTRSQTDDDVLRVHCKRCGTFSCTGTAVSMLFDESITSEMGKLRLGPWESRSRANASGYVAENQDIRIASDDVEALVRLRTPSFHERADKLLLTLERETGFAGQELVSPESRMVGRAWCLNEAELREVLDFLVATERVRESPELGPEARVTISPEGWAHLEHLRERNPGSPQAFVAMSFDPSLLPLWLDGLEPAIRDAGYNPLRIDRKEHTRKIDDEIVAEIRRSKFLVVDLTGQRQSVYFEAGFALGLGITVIWTCRQDEIADLHFDIRQYNCIAWTDPTELKEPLTNRIRAVFGQGPEPSST